MKIARSTTPSVTAFALLALVGAPAAYGQTTTMPSTLRYGSGLMDIPVASVLPHLAITGTYSGFFVQMDRRVQVNASGNASGYGPGIDKYFQDGSVTIGLMDRAEAGVSIQSLNADDEGGNMLGFYGRLQLVQPTNQGIGLAVGARYVTAPSFGTTVDYQPARLGFPDERFRKEYTGLSETVNTQLTLYGVATAHVRGFDEGFLPRHDLTLSVGWGNGMFKDGDRLGYYKFADSEGLFLGSALHFGIGESAILTFMGEYNGFDTNVGAQLDVRGFRVGAHYLAANYGEPTGGYYSEYRKPKFGILASVSICPTAEGLLCKPALMERPEPEVIQLPAPPPDTVRITREVERPLPDGTPAMVCLATGENVQVRVTAQGDTLVGPSRASIRTLRPGVVFAGTYAEGRSWYVNDQDVTFENRAYSRSGNEVRLDCAQIMRVGEHQGVPLFGMRNAERPYQTLYVPVRPGVWQAYQAGLRRTRG